MKIDFPKIVRDFPLSEYAPEVGGVISVWVNPPVKTLDELAGIAKTYVETQGQEQEDTFLSLVSVLLSQGKDAESRWTVDELRELRESSRDTDPSFWWWFNNKIIEIIQDHRLQLKKA